ncbi:MAG: thioredoxin domain-containing protein [Proteobacteria bacterium]|nr:thioredoxin domain-containing protein [Pseudomonadota bacterium]
MRKLLVTSQIILCLGLSAAQPCLAKVFQSVDKTYNAPVAPLDLAVSSDGNYTFILGANGKIIIYTKAGEKEELSVGGDFDRIVTSGDGDKIWLSNQKTKEIKEVYIDFVKKLTSDGSPFLGDDKAPVVITIFSDFQCPHCAQLGELFPKLLEKYPTSIKIVYRYYPLPNHQFAGAAAVASWAAHQQGKFWQYHDLVYANFRDLTMEKLTGFAEQLGLNMPQFQQQMNSQEAKDAVIRDIQEGQTAGVTGTPVMYINGRLVRERTMEPIQKMIDESLKK